MKSKKFRKSFVIVSFLAVPVVLLLLFTYIPFFDMVRYSFYKWNGTSPTMKFIGLKNYIQIFTRSEYLVVFKTSIYYFVGSIVQIVVALYFAVVLTAKIRGASFFKGVIFFPYLINGVAIGFIFMYFFRQAGTLDTILLTLGVPQSKIPLWLGNPRIINYSLASVSVWRYLGQNMVMFAGAIQSINGDLYEAASIDGANRWQQFKYITFPGIKLIISLNLILAVKGAISVFEIPKIMTDGANGSSTFVLKTLDTAFTIHKVGLASAMGVVLLVFIMIVTFIQKRFFEGDER
ncbi:MAG: sugar ABC transporter permease [Butyrivibrio sp.]|nr:sugar ABC transporter permease [Butyrivibrio sp.]